MGFSGFLFIYLFCGLFFFPQTFFWDIFLFGCFFVLDFFWTEVKPM